MTYKEWLEATHPNHSVLDINGIVLIGEIYRKYVEDTTEMDPVSYFQMRNDKGFASWLRNIMHQRSVGKMKDTYRNGFILWTIYKKKVKARLVKFIDDEGFMREIEQPREIYYGEAIKINPEMYDQLSKRILGQEAYVQDEDWASGFLHDPKRFGKAIEEFDPIRQWEKTKKAVEQIRSQFDPYGHKDLIDRDSTDYLGNKMTAMEEKYVDLGGTPDSIIPDHYGGKDDPYEAIKVINAWGLGFCLGNVLKYIKRTGKKGDPTEDLKKAKRYLELELEKYDIHG